ncbi:MAG: helix-turn-helix domain-containing protein [Planctomycetota bacterium]
MAYPVVVRRRALEMVAQGVPKMQVVRELNLTYLTLVTWCKRAEKGELSPRTPGPKKHRPVKPATHAAARPARPASLASA